MQEHEGEAVSCPKDTHGWRVINRTGDRGEQSLLYLRPDGRGYRELRQVDGAKPDVVVTYRHTSAVLWLRLLGPRQLADRMGEAYKAQKGGTK